MPTCLPPYIVNTCTDPSNNPDEYPILSFCTLDTGSIIGDPSPQNQIDLACSQYGGTNPSTGATGGIPFQNPEWAYSNIGEYNSCTTDDSGNNVLNNNCIGSGFLNNGRGYVGYCQRILSSGDPLICSLRDYQCNGNGNVSASTCFSDDNLNSTCNKDFRAPDTPYSNYLLNQLCLGNIPDAIDNFTGLDFISLWVDPQNPNTGNNWTITKTPEGTKYLSSMSGGSDNTCQLDFGGNPSGCSLYTWSPGSPGAPANYLSNPDPYVFNSGIAPCQSIFWRTLYGNAPEFKNQYWSPSEQTPGTCANGDKQCAATSIPPQLAACGANPFQGDPTPSGIPIAKQMLNNVVGKYYNVLKGDLKAPISSSNKSDPGFSEWVFSVCAQYPYLCGDFLKNTVCAGIESDNDFTQNPSALNWCGCYLDKTNLYNTYGNTYGISKQCTPYCNIPDVIPDYDPDTNQPLYCQQSVCMIDNVTISLAKTRLLASGGSGNINFNQICNSCSSSNNNGANINALINGNSSNATNDSQELNSGNASINCSCIINNFTLTTIGATIDGGINLSQACNGNAKCYSNGSTNGPALEIDCHGSSNSQNTVLAKAEAALLKKAKDTTNYWIILIVIILIGLIIIAWLYINPRGLPEQDTVYTKVIDLPSAPQPPPPPQPYNFINYNIGNMSKEKTKTKFY